MKLPDGTILMHANAPYDPKKAHEYYIRTRKLKGRAKAQSKGPNDLNLRVLKDAVAGSYSVKTANGKTATLTAQQLKEQKVYAAARVDSIKKKLGLLQQELSKRMAEAKRAEREADKGPSAADKSKAARESKQYREKNQQKIANTAKEAGSKKKADSADSKPDSVESLKNTIEGVQKNLAAAVARQRSLSSATRTG